MLLADKLRDRSSDYLHHFEGLLYIIVGVLLSVAATAGVVRSGILLWKSIIGTVTAEQGLLVLDQLLLVLMLVEILHTVRISVRSESLIMEPFLIVGLIASIRRVLVITMQAAQMTEEKLPPGSNPLSTPFWHTMFELGLLGFLILVFVGAIYLLRRSAALHGASMEEEPRHVAAHAD